MTTGDDNDEKNTPGMPEHIFITDEEEKKKIADTKFVYVVAPSGVGKSFTGDYLELIMGFKHVDGDYPTKNMHLSDHYKDLGERMLMQGKYAYVKELPPDELVEWQLKEGQPPYMNELAKLALRAALDDDDDGSHSNGIVLSHATYVEPSRSYFRQLLVDNGATKENVITLFLECDFEVNAKALYERSLRQMEMAGIESFEAYQEMFGNVGIKDYDTFKPLVRMFTDLFQGPVDEKEKPYKIVDVTAKDSSVLDSVDVALELDSNIRTFQNLSYEEMISNIPTADAKRDSDSLFKAPDDASYTEKDVAENEPEKYAARRSLLLEAEKLDAVRLSLSSQSCLLEAEKLDASRLSLSISDLDTNRIDNNGKLLRSSTINTMQQGQRSLRNRQSFLESGAMISIDDE